MFPTYLSLTETSVKGWELAQILKRAPHNPANKTVLLDAIADQAVSLHAAGNSRAISLNLFKTEATPAAVEAAITALV